MIYLLLAIILWPVWGWAEEPRLQIYKDAICTRLGDTLHCTKAKETQALVTCEQRMKEAMRILLGPRPFITYKGVLRGQFFGGLIKKPDEPWTMKFSRDYETETQAKRDLDFVRSTMKDCVED